MSYHPGFLIPPISDSPGAVSKKGNRGRRGRAGVAIHFLVKQGAFAGGQIAD
jgi:hypothetical protein